MVVTMDPTGVSEVERALQQIPEIKRVRVVTDGSGKPIEVHVVSAGDKSPKQLVRDVQTVALATTGTQIDHRIVSVVQFPEEATAPTLVPRVTFDEISTETRGKESRVSVTLSSGSSTSSGEASGLTTNESIVRLAATATLEALRNFQSNGKWLALDDIIVQRIGSSEVAVATIIIGPGPGTLSGSAVVLGQPAEAAVRAVLDASNRRLWAQ